MNGEEHILTALVIEGDPQQMPTLCRELASHYPVLSAFSKDDAMHVAESAKPDVIILDVSLHAEEDGFATFCDLRRKDGTRSIPVVMLTEANERLKMEHTAKRMKEYSGVASITFIEKPVASERLCGEVRRMIGSNPSRYCCQPKQEQEKADMLSRVNC